MEGVRREVDGRIHMLEVEASAEVSSVYVPESGTTTSSVLFGCKLTSSGLL